MDVEDVMNRIRQIVAMEEEGMEKAMIGILEDVRGLSPEDIGKCLLLLRQISDQTAGELARWQEIVDLLEEDNA